MLVVMRSKEEIILLEFFDYGATKEDFSEHLNEAGKFKKWDDIINGSSSVKLLLF